MQYSGFCFSKKCTSAVHFSIPLLIIANVQSGTSFFLVTLLNFHLRMTHQIILLSKKKKKRSYFSASQDCFHPCASFCTCDIGFHLPFHCQVSQYKTSSFSLGCSENFFYYQTLSVHQYSFFLSSIAQIQIASRWQLNKVQFESITNCPFSWHFAVQIFDTACIFTRNDEQCN